VTEEVGPALTLSDPELGTVGIFTAIRQREVAGFLAVRLKVEGGRITEAEQIISTRRNLSSPPTPIGEVDDYVHDPVIGEAVSANEQAGRDALAAHANGYFDTLQRNERRDSRHLLSRSCHAPRERPVVRRHRRRLPLGAVRLQQPRSA
jgi:hypothetical protein